MSVAVSNVELLARRIEHDIRVRGLRPGDRYLTADEAGQMLEVSTVSAHRAMRLLSERRILVRQRKAGTFVGEGIGVSPAVRKKVHLIVASDVGRDQATAMHFLSNDLIAGVTEAMPGVSVQIDLMTPAEGIGVVRELVNQSRQSDAFAGAILVRSTLEMQRFFEAERLPAVVYGTLQPTIATLGHVDLDQEQIGRVTAEHVLQRGYRNVRLLMFEHWAPGDNVFVANFTRTLQRAGKAVRMEVISVASDERVIEHVMHPVLEATDRPDVIVARAAGLAQPLPGLMRSLGLRVPDDVALMVANYRPLEIDGVAQPYVEAMVDTRERGRMLGRMLQALQTDASAARQALVPVQFNEGANA